MRIVKLTEKQYQRLLRLVGPCDHVASGSACRVNGVMVKSAITCAICGEELTSAQAFSVFYNKKFLKKVTAELVVSEPISEDCELDYEY